MFAVRMKMGPVRDTNDMFSRSVSLGPIMLRASGGTG